MTKRHEKTSPLRERPLNSPAESSVRYLWGTVFGEHLLLWVVAWAMLLADAVGEWWRWLTKSPPSPVFATVLALAMTLVLLLRVLPRALKQAREINLGIEGEKHVAEVLDELKAEGYYVINDIVEDGYNIDHVLIGPTGVYVIETKTRSKLEDRRDVRVKYDGQRVLVDGFEHDRDPLKQVQALADCVRAVLRAGTGLTPPIRPVVLFPGWFVEPQPKGVSIWVLSPAALPAFVRNEPVRLSERDVEVLHHALDSHARAAGTRRS